MIKSILRPLSFVLKRFKYKNDNLYLFILKPLISNIKDELLDSVFLSRYLNNYMKKSKFMQKSMKLQLCNWQKPICTKGLRGFITKKAITNIISERLSIKSRLITNT